MKTKPKYGIYCLYHNKVFPKYYRKQIDKITFVKMDKGDYVFPSKKHIYLAKMPYFHPIGKEWAEYEFYYSLYKGYLKGLVKLPEYIGFIQYDMGFYGITEQTKDLSVIDFIEKLIKDRKLSKKSVIAFQPVEFRAAWMQRFIMDKTRPNKNRDPNFENCLETIRKRCNLIAGSNLSLSKLNNSRIIMCGSFFSSRDVFLELMHFLSKIIEDGSLSVYNKKKRMQGGLAERYVALLLAGMALNRIDFELRHDFLTGDKIRDVTASQLFYSFIGSAGILFKRRLPWLYRLLKPYFPDKKPPWVF